MSDETTGRHVRPGESEAGVSQLKAGVTVFAISVAALVYLQTMNLDTTTLMVLCGPVVAALLVNGYMSKLTDAQNAKIEQVIKQTNGALDERIEARTMAALAKVGLLAPPNGSPVAADDLAAGDVRQNPPR